MNRDLSSLTDDEIRERRDALYWQVQKAGCPREVVLEFNDVEDEYHERLRRDPPMGVCNQVFDEDEVHSYWEQPPGPEWGA